MLQGIIHHHQPPRPGDGPNPCAYRRHDRRMSRWTSPLHAALELTSRRLGQPPRLCFIRCDLEMHTSKDITVGPLRYISRLAEEVACVKLSRVLYFQHRKGLIAILCYQAVANMESITPSSSFFISPRATQSPRPSRLCHWSRHHITSPAASTLPSTARIKQLASHVAVAVATAKG